MATTKLCCNEAHAQTGVNKLGTFSPPLPFMPVYTTVHNFTNEYPVYMKWDYKLS